ncbi:MAG: hypothetical protein CMI54_04205 [Parcubacteria group bacterium]|jgi:hypothetical protein|nr:hypothetical protein [Parcubacteria group bacterium]|tara:strand:- start:719 stop:985 length:267 start_codon:yes stop_codon:yes gene_type:complete
MSLKNRKQTYEKLIAAGRFSHISDKLKAEFGDPEAKDGFDISYSDMTKKQLQDHATKAGLEFTTKSTKDDLVVLLENKSDGIESGEEK